MVLSSPPLLLAAALTASSITPLPVQSLQIKPSPPSHPPKPFSSSLSSNGSGLPTTAAATTTRSSKQRRSSATPLCAYTVSDNTKNKNPWMSFMKFPISFGDPASQFGDSLFSFEGGSDALKAAAARKPYMPNLEMETAAIIATATKKLEDDMDFTMEQDELLLELDTLTKTFDDLQSSMDYKSQLYSETIEGYQSKIVTLEEKNDLLEGGLSVLTLTLERQEEQIEKLLLQPEKDDDDDDGTTKEGEQHLLMQVQDEVKNSEKENGMLRQRLRFLEAELSDVAFESRKVVMPDPPAVVEKQTDDAVVVVASVDNDVKLTPKAPSAPVPPHIHQQRQLELIPDPPVAVETLTDDALNSSSEAVVQVADNDVKLTPMAPSAPVPPHIYQQRQLEQFQQQVNEYKRERSSVRKLFGLGIRRGATKVGKALNLWSPAYNLRLWGELRRQ